MYMLDRGVRIVRQPFEHGMTRRGDPHSAGTQLVGYRCHFSTHGNRMLTDKL